MQAQPPSNYPRQDVVGDRGQLREIAIAQKQLILCILANIGLVILNMILGQIHMIALGFVVLLLFVGLAIFELICVSRLAKSLGFSAILYLIAMFIPCISLIALIVLVTNASNRLKAAGITVGLMGADPNQI